MILLVAPAAFRGDLGGCQEGEKGDEEKDGEF